MMRKTLKALLGLLLVAPMYAQSTGCSAGPNGCGILNVGASSLVTIASAGTIAPTSNFVVITGTAAIATITPPANFSATVGGCFDILATGAWTTTTAGNIFATMTASANTTYRACYFTVSGTSKFYIK
jgi:hypothetical protein